MIDVRLERDELHERLGGGIPHGTLGLVEGGPGAGKSILTQRILYGALHNGATATVVSTELTTPAFLTQMASVGYPVTPHVLTGALQFLPLTPLYAKTRDAPQRLQRLLATTPLWNRDLVIVDTVSRLMGLDLTDAPARPSEAGAAAVTALARRATEGTAILLTADPAEAPDETLAPLRAAATAHLALTLSTRGSVNRNALVRRYARSPAAASDTFSFRVEPREGLVVEIRSVS